MEIDQILRWHRNDSSTLVHRFKHTRGPWQVECLLKDDYTHYFVREHTHPAISIDRAYWEKGYRPPEDDDGYYQPDENADISEHKIANARLIAVAPVLLDAAMRLYTDLSIRVLAAADTEMPPFDGLDKLQMILKWLNEGDDAIASNLLPVRLPESTV